VGALDEIDRLRKLVDTLRAQLAEADDLAAALVVIGQHRQSDPSTCAHAGQRTIDRATGDEWCDDCGALNPR
jgi:hypothetical protein